MTPRQFRLKQDAWVDDEDQSLTREFFWVAVDTVQSPRPDDKVWHAL